MGDLHELLNAMIEQGASDLHLTVGSPPQLRIDGQLTPLKSLPLTAAETKQLCYSILTDPQKHRFEEDHDLGLSFGVMGLSRFRANLFMQRGAVAGAFRTIPFRIPSLQELGLPASVENLAKKPWGLVVVTGPTGSGKCTTLSAIVDKINSEQHEHIVTIEDPIEYVFMHKKGMVNQREVQADTPSFQAALQHVLRQDPDVIMIGELPNQETLTLAIKAALTGHLILTELEANDTADAVKQLLEFGAEPLHLASALVGVISQRLVRKICPKCKKPDKDAVKALLEIGLSPAKARSAKVFRGKGCPECNNTGYKGRVAVYEILEPNRSIKQKIADKTSVAKLRSLAKKQGMKTLRQNALEKAFEGITTLEEVLRVTTKT